MASLLCFGNIKHFGDPLRGRCACLHDVTVSAQREPSVNVFLLAEIGKDDACGALIAYLFLFNLLQELEAIHTRHNDVNKADIRFESLLELPERFCSRRNRSDLKTGFRKLGWVNIDRESG